MFILTGGSSVYKDMWSSCDNPIRDGNDYISPIQREIDRKFGICLLARGLVGGTFSYAKLGDILIIQTRRKWSDYPQPHIFWTSLLMAMTEYPDETFMIHTQFDEQTCNAIRRRIESKLPRAIGSLFLHHVVVERQQ